MSGPEMEIEAFSHVNSGESMCSEQLESPLLFRFRFNSTDSDCRNRACGHLSVRGVVTCQISPSSDSSFLNLE
jgi:hypothetical protein